MSLLGQTSVTCRMKGDLSTQGTVRVAEICYQLGGLSAATPLIIWSCALSVERVVYKHCSPYGM